MLTSWQDRLAHVVAMMREISFQTEPAAITAIYQKRIRAVEQYDRYVSISRRGLEAPWFRVTRDSEWKTPLDPWKDREKLPLLRGGLVADILYNNEPRLLLNPEVPRDDPAFGYVGGYGAIIAVPHYDNGEALNWVIHLRREASYDPEELPELVWLSNLFGRMTYSLVIAGKLKNAHDALDAELRLVADVQRSLLHAPTETPGLTTAAWSQPARRAGGDYYAVISLKHGRTGLFIADASGHSAPATVLMAMVHTMLRLCPDRDDPAACLTFIDRGLRESGPRGRVDFVTAFYGVFDPAQRALTYARAGHPPPRLCKTDSRPIHQLDAVGDLPLGLNGTTAYESAAVALDPGDLLVCYTDGVTDATNSAGESFDVARLDYVIADACAAGAGATGSSRGRDAPLVLNQIRTAIANFSGGVAPEDDCSLLVAAVE